MAKKEIKIELTKAKRTLREKDREIVKLKADVNRQGQVPLKGIVENSSFTIKEVGAPLLVKGPRQPSDDNGESTSAPQKDPVNAQLTQIKLLQKKVRDLGLETKVKKTKIEELELTVKQE